MGQQNKARMYNALKDAGVPLDKHYRNYTEAELQPAYDRLVELQSAQAAASVLDPEPQPEPVQQPEPVKDEDPIDPEAAAFFGYESQPPKPEAEPVDHVPYPEAPSSSNPYPGATEVAPPVKPKDPEEMAGQRLNTQGDEPIRTDEHGRIWYQEEVLKPAFPKPRGRRKLTYMDTGTKQIQVKAGEFTESFEVAGDEQRVSEVRITLPSYQVGVYKDPRFPFKIHTYNGINGFDFFEVQEFYGGAELVPAEIKRMYVENVLCYDIRTTVRAIEQEARQLQLRGRI